MLYVLSHAYRSQDSQAQTVARLWPHRNAGGYCGQTRDATRAYIRTAIKRVREWQAVINSQYAAIR